MKISNLTVLSNHLRQSFQWWSEGIISISPQLISKFICKQQHLYFFPSKNCYEVKLISKHDNKVKFSFKIQPDIMNIDIFGKLKPYRHLKRFLVLEKRDFLYFDIATPDQNIWDMREMVSYQIPQLTPFKVDDVFFQNKNLSSSKNCTKVILLPKFIAQEHIKFLKKNNLSPDYVTNSSNDNMSIKLAPHYLTHRKKENLFLYFMNILLVLSILSFIGSHFYFQEQKLLAYKSANTLAVKEINNALRIQKDIKKTNLKLVKIFDRYNDQPSINLLFNELRNIVNENTYLNSIKINNKVVVIAGVTNNAANLIQKIQSSKSFTNVKLIGPITRNESKDEEGFSLRLTFQGNQTDAISKK